MTNADGARRWLSLVGNSITSSQHRIIGHGLPEDRPSVAVNIGITADGLRALGLPQEVMRTFPVEFQDGIASEERSRILGDTGASAPETWEIGGPRTEPVHAMLMLFAPDESALDELCRVQRDDLTISGGAVELPGSMQRGYRPDTLYGAVRISRRHRATINRGSLRPWRADGRVHPRIRESLRVDAADARGSTRDESSGHARPAGQPVSRRQGSRRSGATRFVPGVSKAAAGRRRLLAVHGARSCPRRQAGFCACGVARIEVRRTLAVRRTVDAGSRCRRSASRRS